MVTLNELVGVDLLFCDDRRGVEGTLHTVQQHNVRQRARFTRAKATLSRVKLIRFVPTCISRTRRVPNPHLKSVRAPTDTNRCQRDAFGTMKNEYCHLRSASAKKLNSRKLGASSRPSIVEDRA